MPTAWGAPWPVDTGCLTPSVFTGLRRSGYKRYCSGNLRAQLLGGIKVLDRSLNFCRTLMLLDAKDKVNSVLRYPLFVEKVPGRRELLQSRNLTGSELGIRDNNPLYNPYILSAYIPYYEPASNVLRNWQPG